ncbi:nitrate- and nitrite sensing domain-containing protein [Actinoallomurus spadix]|uniref:histidine kinase n=1 Tax=Actinoallomurus spadix TaxID=79912 RepID=A0ABP3FX49_9ACTN|nr:nitrate- and nitrite sensing domain-containing protein [Actinoallomurus spadix]MCO5986078.1 nitrate- and nitrite sensing domain-containing protein [Actinoallomurus spadix]
MSLRNWRVPVRLVALIAIPTAVAVLLAGLRVSSALGDATVFARIEHLAGLGQKVTVFAQALADERDMTAFYETSSDAAVLAELRQRQRTTDSAALAVRAKARGIDAGYSPPVRAGVQNLLIRLNSLPALRQITAQPGLPALPGISKYSQLISELFDLDDRIAQGSTETDVSEAVRALGALSRAKEASSRERALLTAALNSGRFEPVELQALQSARAERDSALSTFDVSATVNERQLYEDTVTSPEIDRSEYTRLQAIRVAQDSRALKLKPLGPQDTRRWFDDMTNRLDRMNTVEQNIASHILSVSGKHKKTAQRGAVIDTSLLFLVLILVLMATVIVARSMVRPLRTLRAGALDVASNRLPEMVRRLREPDAGNEPLHVEPIDVHTTDEIGEVARSFDEVHREAVRLASNEALLRSNVNAMFVNLSRRSQSLIERQLRLIEDLEQSEQDAARLESLFKLDHLATRMRRNGENLLVLGGQEQTRRWNKPVALVDIVRASLSEVEQYERVTLRIQDDVSVIGRVVNDLVHLTAELVENATSFSPEHTKVAVSGHLLSGGGAMLQISDNGVGMSPQELEEANWKLANPPTIDVSISRRMGLFVVGRLAQRHGIRVELRAALSGGLTAFVILPANAIQDGNPPTPRRLDSPVEAAPRRASSVEAPAVHGQLARGAEPVAPAPVPDTPWEPARAVPETGRTAFEPAPMEAEPPTSPFESPRSPAEPLRRQAEPVWDEPEPAEPVWGGRREPERRPAEPAEPAYGQSEQPRGPQGAPLPKRKQANTSPPGRGAASSAPGRAGTPGGAPPPARPSRPQNPPFPPARQSTQPPATGSMREEGRLGDQNGGRSPIFEAMQSEWFQRRKTGSMARSESTPPPEWSSPADEGFRAAETVRAPAVGGKTAAGLPKRVPGSNRIPGSIASARPAPQPQQSMQQPIQPPARPAFQPPEAETVRNRFSSFQQGVRRGRAAIRPEDDERENQ